ncbi:hypothetical protein DMUE_0017 [Dictyocoela muelleri]|nr:hypothetical protein DMUE_0017 [Dictyocoela muelleri]
MYFQQAIIASLIFNCFYINASVEKSEEFSEIQNNPDIYKNDNKVLSQKFNDLLSGDLLKFENEETFSDDETFSEDKTFSEDETFSEDKTFSEEETFSEDETFSEEEKSNKKLIKITKNELISTFSDIFLRDLSERAIDYATKYGYKKNIMISVIDDYSKYIDCITGTEAEVAYYNEKFTYERLAKLINNPNTKKTHIIYESTRHALFSQFIPNEDDINIIWNLYNEIGKYKRLSNKYLIITLTLDNIQGLNIRKEIKSNCFWIIVIDNSEKKEYLLTNPISLTAGSFNEKLENKVLKQFYTISYELSGININTPVLNINFKFDNEDENIYLNVTNKFTNEKYKLRFLFKKDELEKIIFNGKNLVLEKNTIENLFTSLKRFNDKPFSKFNNECFEYQTVTCLSSLMK